MKKYKGIVLAGGSGTRLHPLTASISKQLLPVYDKPMIYYPLSVLMLADIKDILIIVSPRDLKAFENLLGDGNQLGVKISYQIQETPRGVADALLIAEDFIGDDSVILALGDNIFYGQHFSEQLKKAKTLNTGATIFGYPVGDPERFGVVEFDANGEVHGIEEKPRLPKSNFAVTGLYFYNSSVVEIVKEMTPSSRGELEITDVNLEYLRRGEIRIERLGRGFAWLDTGTCDSLMEAGAFIQTIERRQGLKIACLEEIALGNEWISIEKLRSTVDGLENSQYKKYLKSLIKETRSF